MIDNHLQPLILNLAGELSEELKSFLQKQKIEIITKDEISSEKLSYILVKDESQVVEVCLNFDVIENEIFIICLSEVSNTKNFLLHNGRLALDEKMLQDLGYLSLVQNFFEKFTAVHLGDLIPNYFDEYHQFDISEYSSIGQMTDELAIFAQNRDFNPVVLRTFVDHVVYYFSYLRQAGLAHIPFEFECGFSPKTMAIEVNVTMRNFVAEYLLDSFGDVSSKNPLHFLLGIVQKSCDFLHVNYIEETSKLILVGVWSQNSQYSSGNILFQNIFSTEQTLKRIEDKVQNYNEISRDEVAKTTKLPGSLVEMVINPDKDSFLGAEEELTSDLMAFIIGHFEMENFETSLQDMTDDEIKSILKNYPDQEIIKSLHQSDEDHLINRVRNSHIAKVYQDEIARVRGHFEEDADYKKSLNQRFQNEAIRKISGSLEADVINRILGTQDPRESVTTIKGVKEKRDDFVARFDKGFEKETSMFDFDKMEKSKKREVIQDAFKNTISRFYKSPEVDPKHSLKLKEYLRSFSSHIDRNIEDFTNADLENFRKNELPKFFLEDLDDENILFSKPEMSDQFKKVLEENLKKVERFQNERELSLSLEDLKSEEIKRAIEKSVHDIFPKDEQRIKEELTVLMPGNEDNILNALREAKNTVKQEELQDVLDNLYMEQEKVEKGQVDLEAERAKVKSMTESELVKKLKKSQEENKRLLHELQALKVVKESNSKVDSVVSSINEEAQARTEEVLEEDKSQAQLSEPFDNISSEKQKLIDDIHSGKKLSDAQSNIIQELLDKERAVKQKERETELTLRKNAIENQQKESLFIREFEKAQKMITSKDLVLQKAKESMKTLVTKKELEIQNLNKKVQDLLKKMADDKTVLMEKEIFSLRKDNENLARMTDIYKNKLSSMAKSVMKNNIKDDARDLEGQNRELSRFKIQLENNLNNEIKRNKIAQEQLNTFKNQERELRLEVIKLNGQLKAVNAATKSFKNEMEVRLKEASAKKVAEVASVTVQAQNSSGKEKQLELQTKKLNSELSKAKGMIAEEKKNFVKLKSENTALKNQLSKLKKDMAKLENAKNAKKAA